MSRRHPEKKKRPTTITIPRRVAPHVRLVFEEMRRQNVTYDEVEEGSGVRRAALKAWRHKNRPGLDSIEAVLGFLGWDFVPIPRVKALPKPLVADLQPIADKHGLSLTDTIETLVALVARIHERFASAASKAPREPAPAASRRRKRGEPHPDQPAFIDLAADEYRVVE